MIKRLITIRLKDIARQAGVSVAVASKVLNDSRTNVRVGEELRRKILKIAKQMGYRPNPLARALAKGKTYSVGIVFSYPPHLFLRDPSASQIVAGVWDKVSKAGYNIFLKSNKGKKLGYFPSIEDLKGRVDGVIAIGPVRADDEEVAKWNEFEIPVILIGNHPGFKGSTVDVDNEKGGYLATKHLLSLGHRRIGLITISPQQSFVRERYFGFIRALKEAGIEAKKDWIEIAEIGDEGGYEAMMRLLSSTEPPSAVFVSAGVCARGALQAIRAVGLDVPKDISFVAFDRFMENFPQELSITTVEWSFYKLGLLSASVLLRLMQGTLKGPVRRRLSVKLVIGASTDKPKEIKKKGGEKR
ncbi:MAG: LacI family DNA-binding transcriptional regulator [bacterium]